MIVFTIKVNQLSFEVLANIDKDFLHKGKHRVVEDFASIFSDKDQMDMHIKNAVSNGYNLV